MKSWRVICLVRVKVVEPMPVMVQAKLEWLPSAKGKVSVPSAVDTNLGAKATALNAGPVLRYSVPMQVSRS